MPSMFSQTLATSAPENYERYFVPAIGEPLAAELVDEATLKPGEKVLDVACGTGIVARLALDQVGKEGSVAGLDMNPGMLAVARAAASDLPIEWHEGSAEKMPLPDGKFDVAICQMGLQFMDDRARALKEMWRVLADEGRVFLNMPGPAPRMMEIFADAMGRHIAREARGFALQVFSLYDIGEIRRMLGSAGFRYASAAAHHRKLRLPAAKDFLWQYVSSTPLSGLATRAGEDACAALEREVVEKWQPYEEDGALTLDLTMVSANARK